MSDSEWSLFWGAVLLSLGRLFNVDASRWTQIPDLVGAHTQISRMVFHIFGPRIPVATQLNV